MLRFLHTHLDRPLSEAERLARMEYELGREAPSWQQPLSLPQSCQKQLKITSVAVVGGGLAGLMAARRLCQHGIKVTVFEARDQLGGRVLSNTSFSNGRITEEGAELIGSFHTTWLALARYYGLGVISRMNGNLCDKAGLNVKLTLDKPLSRDEIRALDQEVEWRILRPIGKLASSITDPSKPWLQPILKQYDNTSVASALTRLIPRGGRLWKAMEFLLVNNEVAQLDEMNLLGLLCKVKGGQLGTADKHLMGYWNELEIFRCADGCQTLARMMANEIRTTYGAKIHLSRVVTHIDLSQTKVRGVLLGSKEVIDQDTGRLAPGPPDFTQSHYVILANPPSVWPELVITPSQWHPKNEIGIMGMGGAVKFFSDVKERFWIKEGAAPLGGSLRLGQVWEGTDNQTRVRNQGIVLSVFAGPTLSGRVPTPDVMKDELPKLYPGYPHNLIKTLFTDWPNRLFIKTGYAAPRKGDIFKIGKKLSEPFHGRLFFGGEHTQMDFFGYMEGALRSGHRAADQLMRVECGLLREPQTTSSVPRAQIAQSAALQRKPAFEHDFEIPVEEELEAEERWEELVEDS
jgi:monoamine oxidase